MKRMPLIFAFACVLISGAGCTTQKKEQTPDMLQTKIDRFAPTVITADTSGLSPGNRSALRVLMNAMHLVDQLYLRQEWSGNEQLLPKLQGDQSLDGRERLEYFMMNMGPWSQLDNNEPFIPGVPRQPPGANYYPEGMKKEEFEVWVSTLPESEQKSAKGFFTAIRRKDDGELGAVRYSDEYKDLLTPLAEVLRTAAGLTDNASLRSFLLKRAEAFQSNDYYESDVAWMKLDSPIDVTIGPYEVYLDELFNYKAAFEAFITLRNDEETAKLQRLTSYLQEIENHLPIAPRYRNPKLGALAPIRVVDEVAIGGEARGGVQTAAYNLPNDERIVREMGSKRVMLRNVQEAKFNKVLLPISRIALDSTQRTMVQFEPFFTHILAHELMHGLGPHNITAHGHATTVRQEMKELGSALEEAKADISGLFAFQYLIDKGVFPNQQEAAQQGSDKSTPAPTLEQQLYATYLAGIFRTLRFGFGDAHGKGMALQCNYLWDEGAIVYNESSGTFQVIFPKIRVAVSKLTGEIMTIQAEGSYDKARALLDRYVTIRPLMQRALDALKAIPVDIRPSFPLAGEPDVTGTK